MGKSEKGAAGTAKEIIDGIGVGFFFSIFLSLYITNFTDIQLPIWIIYGILAPLVSAMAITAMIYSSKEKRDRYMVKYWAETQRRQKEKEKGLWR